jgi:hypothetical protein
MMFVLEKHITNVYHPLYLWYASYFRYQRRSVIHDPAALYACSVAWIFSNTNGNDDLGRSSVIEDNSDSKYRALN